MNFLKYVWASYRLQFCLLLAGASFVLTVIAMLFVGPECLGIWIVGNIFAWLAYKLAIAIKQIYRGIKEIYLEFKQPEDIKYDKLINKLTGK